MADLAERYSTAEQYVGRLRNEHKRVYAKRLLAWWRAGRLGREPTWPEGLNYMGAQSVRLALDEILEPT
jgi:hypothetical protein